MTKNSLKEPTKIYDGLVSDEERSLYGITQSVVKNCRFEGPLDGESCLKETSYISVEDCSFSLRYPLWHNRLSTINNSIMEESCRAPLWYCSDLKISNLKAYGVKAIRECCKVSVEDSFFSSAEFCWLSKDISFKNCEVISYYPFFKVERLKLQNLKLVGKYSLQYCNDVVIEDSYLDTKDALWHSKDAVIKDSYVKGEYLAWYSENLTFINCTIEGTQPFCYAKNLKIVNCKMVGCDLAFENSTVDAVIQGDILSVKNPVGSITADKIGEVIIDSFKRGECKITQLINK